MSLQHSLITFNIFEQYMGVPHITKQHEYIASIFLVQQVHSSKIKMIWKLIQLEGNNERNFAVMQYEAKMLGIPFSEV